MINQFKSLKSFLGIFTIFLLNSCDKKNPEIELESKSVEIKSYFFQTVDENIGKLEDGYFRGNYFSNKASYLTNKTPDELIEELSILITDLNSKIDIQQGLFTEVREEFQNIYEFGLTSYEAFLKFQEKVKEAENLGDNIVEGRKKVVELVQESKSISGIDYDEINQLIYQSDLVNRINHSVSLSAGVMYRLVLVMKSIFEESESYDFEILNLEEIVDTYLLYDQAWKEISQIYYEYEDLRIFLENNITSDDDRYDRKEDDEKIEIFETFFEEQKQRVEKFKTHYLECIEFESKQNSVATAIENDFIRKFMLTENQMFIKSREAIYRWSVENAWLRNSVSIYSIARFFKWLESRDQAISNAEDWYQTRQGDNPPTLLTKVLNELIKIKNTNNYLSSTINPIEVPQEGIGVIEWTYPDSEINPYVFDEGGERFEEIENNYKYILDFIKYHQNKCECESSEELMNYVSGGLGHDSGGSGHDSGGSDTGGN